MPVFSLISLLSAILSFMFTCLVFYKNPQKPLNRVFAFLCLSISANSFLEFMIRQSETAQRASMWFDLKIIEIFSTILFFHFIIIFTKFFTAKKTKMLLIITYMVTIGCCIFSLLHFKNELVHDYWGWSYKNHNTLNFAIIKGWEVFLTIVALVLLFAYWVKAKNKENRIQSGIILIVSLIVSVFAIITELFFPICHIVFPEMTNASFTLISLVLLIGIWRYKLFSVSVSMAADSIISKMVDGLVVIDLERRIEIVNKSLLQMLGYIESELLGKRVELIIAHFKNGTESLSKLFNTGSINDVETTLLKKNGVGLLVSLSWTILRDSKGTMRGMIFIARDITERERTREALEHARDELEKRVNERTAELQKTNSKLRKEISERKIVESQLDAQKERLSVTLRSIGDGVITTDEDGKIVLLNKAAEQITGWRQDDAVGRSLEDVYRVCMDEEMRSENELLSIVKKTRSVHLEKRSQLTSLDGTNITISESIAPIFDQSGKIIGIVLVFRDISERIKMEEELFRTRKFESVSLLAGGIAHDFNNLLTGIITNLFMTKMNLTQDSESYSLVNSAEKAAFRASSLTNQLLSFAKGSSPIREDASIKELIEESVGFYLSGSKCDYKLDFANELWKVHVNRGQIDQVLNNIIINADQAMYNGGTIRVCAENTEITEDLMLPLKAGKYVRISISDQGSGISAEHLARIFDPYFTTREEGNGLGLTTAFSIIKRHNGHITVDSELGKGTIFQIYVPAVETQNSEEDEDVLTDTPETEPAERKGRILLMDDEELVRRSAGRVLVHLGYRITMVENGADAIKEFNDSIEQEDPYDVVILDLTIPGGLGAREVVREIVSVKPDACVIVSSGYTNDKVMTNYKEYGFSAAAHKPYNIEELNNLLQQIMFHK